MNFVHLVRGGLFHHQQTNPSATRTPSAPDQTEATKLQQVRMSGFGGFSHDDQDEEVKLSDDLKSRMLSMLQEYKTRRSREETEWNAIDDVDTQFDLALNKTLSAIHAYRALMTSQLIMRSDADKLAFLKFVGVEWQGQGPRAYRRGGSIFAQPNNYTLNEMVARTVGETPVSTLETFVVERHPDRPEVKQFVTQEGRRLRDLLLDVLEAETEAVPHMEVLYCKDHTPTTELTPAALSGAMPRWRSYQSSAAEEKSAAAENNSEHELPTALADLIASMTFGAGADRVVQCVFDSDVDLQTGLHTAVLEEFESAQTAARSASAGAGAGAAGAGESAGSGSGSGSGFTSTASVGAGAGAASGSGSGTVSHKRSAAAAEFDWNDIPEQPPKKRARLESKPSVQEDEDQDDTQMTPATPTPSFVIVSPIDWERRLNDEYQTMRFMRQHFGAARDEDADM
jgi:hypothetical protein